MRKPAPDHRPPTLPDVRPRLQDAKPREWRPEVPNVSRSELRRIVLEMID